MPTSSQDSRYAGANRYAYLDEYCDPSYVGSGFPKLTTPQWVGDEGVEAVVVLAIDDLYDGDPWRNFLFGRTHWNFRVAEFETYLRPVIERLKAIDGRAPISIMTNRVAPRNPTLQTWLREGLSLEVHTIDHPCPLLRRGKFAKAKRSFDRCVDLVNSIPGNTPVAFRMPCCDVNNTTSPRFWTEIFSKTTSNGHFLAIDSSVANVITSSDDELPSELHLDQGDGERFRKYLPSSSYVNTVENYPYPYVVNRLCWQFPFAVPTDSQAQRVNGPNHHTTVEDLSLAIDAAVVKKGVFTFLFHPHGWLSSGQIVELIERAVERHGKRIKFLTFREALSRLNENLLDGQPIRAADGGDNGVRLLDLNHDGNLDVVIGNERVRKTRLWSTTEERWIDGDFPTQIVGVDEDGTRAESGIRFGCIHDTQSPSMLVANEQSHGAWSFEGDRWQPDERLLRGGELNGVSIQTSQNGLDQGIRLRSIDGKTVCQLVVSNPSAQAVFQWDGDEQCWKRSPFRLPDGVYFVDEHGRDAGLRLIDIDGDGSLDVIFSNHQRYAAYRFKCRQSGWDEILTGPSRGGVLKIPTIARRGTNNGAWFNSGRLCVQNEDTDRLPDGVDVFSLDRLLQDNH